MEITLPIKSGSDVTLPKEPPWFKHMDSIFIETNAEVRLSSPTQEPWFGVDDGKSGEELNDSSEEDRGEHTIETYKQIMMKIWIARTQLIKKLPRKNAKQLSLLIRNQRKPYQTNRFFVKLPVD